MSSTTMEQVAKFEPDSARSEFSWFERTALRRTHPTSIFVDVVAWIWVVYFLWNHGWQAALATVVAARIVALIAVRNLNVKDMSETTLGKIALLHLHPINLALQIAGFAILLYGIWEKTTESILVGLSLVFVGHVFGWSKVNRKYSLQERSTP